MAEKPNRNDQEQPNRASQYEAPSLLLVGHAHDVVLGIDSIGNDCNGMTEPQFEFLEDGRSE
jgi:hypothetical protein